MGEEIVITVALDAIMIAAMMAITNQVTDRAIAEDRIRMTAIADIHMTILILAGLLWMIQETGAGQEKIQLLGNTIFVAKVAVTGIALAANIVEARVPLEEEEEATVTTKPVIILKRGSSHTHNTVAVVTIIVAVLGTTSINTATITLGGKGRTRSKARDLYHHRNVDMISIPPQDVQDVNTSCILLHKRRDGESANTHTHEKDIDTLLQ